MICMDMKWVTMSQMLVLKAFISFPMITTSYTAFDQIMSNSLKEKRYAHVMRFKCGRYITEHSEQRGIINSTGREMK